MNSVATLMTSHNTAARQGLGPAKVASFGAEIVGVVQAIGGGGGGGGGSSRGASAFEGGASPKGKSNGLQYGNKPLRKPSFVYTLKLADGCWYVGTTNHPPSRLKQHREGGGSEWTRQHPPTSKGFDGLKPPSGGASDEAQARIDEDAEVKRLMRLHGIDKVRGGTYSRVVLSRADVKALSKELRHAEGGCLRCGHQSHWVTGCRARIDVAGNEISDDDEEGVEVGGGGGGGGGDGGGGAGGWRVGDVTPRSASEVLPRKRKRAQGNDNSCHRCGRGSHETEGCYAKTDAAGNPIQAEQHQHQHRHQHQHQHQRGRRQGGGNYQHSRRSDGNRGGGQQWEEGRRSDGSYEDDGQAYRYSHSGGGGGSYQGSGSYAGGTGYQNNCGGGSYTQGSSVSDALQEDDANNGGSCHRCRRDTHWARDCYAKTYLDGGRIKD
jgi:hypothetical protein